MFDKIVGNFIGNFAAFLVSAQARVLGFKTLDALLFNKGVTDEVPPFPAGHWEQMKKWYLVMEGIAGALLFIAVGYTAYKFIAAGFNPKMREEAIDSLNRLFFSVIIILLAPLFVEVLLRINNALVGKLAEVVATSLGNVSLDSKLGATGDFIRNIRTGNAVTTALVLLMFAWINFKLNLLFIIRYFVITVFYIFTPIVAVMWSIEKTVNAAGIWIGEMISNAFMQFAYAFVFSIYLSFAGRGDTNWATSVVWAFLLISVAEVLRNSVQTLFTKLSGLNESAEASKVLAFFGLGGLASAGRSLSQQFSTISGPGGSALYRTGMAMAKGAGMGMAFASATNDMTTSATNNTMASAGTSTGVSVGANVNQSTTATGTATDASNTGTPPTPNTPLTPNNTIQRTENFVKTLDAYNIAGHTLGRLTTAAGSLFTVGGDREAKGIVNAAGGIVALGARAAGSTVGFARAVKQYAKEQNISGYRALMELTGADKDPKWTRHVRTFWRAANLAVSNVVSGDETVRHKLLTYHATSFDGVRYK